MPVDAEWFVSPLPVPSTDAERAFQFSIVPDFLASSAECWKPLPLMPGDLVYHQSRKAPGGLESNTWALIRKNQDSVTLYVNQSQDSRRFGGLQHDLLTKEPVDMGWVPSQGSLYLRSGGTEQAGK